MPECECTDPFDPRLSSVGVRWQSRGGSGARSGQPRGGGGRRDAYRHLKLVLAEQQKLELRGFAPVDAPVLFYIIYESGAIFLFGIYWP